MRKKDILVCFLFAMAYSTFSAILIDPLLAFNFCLLAFFIFFSEVFLRRFSGSLMCLFVAIISIFTQSFTGPGSYKLLLFSLIGIIYFFLRLTMRTEFATLATITAFPLVIWAIIGFDMKFIESIFLLTLSAFFSGLVGILIGIFIWNKVSNSKWIIRFQCE